MQEDPLAERIRYINIIGAGLAGLSAAKTLAETGHFVRLISVQPSQRAQSNLAEGGINASLNVMGEDDTISEHFEDSMKGGCYLADPVMVKGLTDAAPGIVRELESLGVPFNREKGHIIQRNFGGQKKKRTAFAKSSTGKMLTTALIDEVRKHEASGHVLRLSHHRFERLLVKDGICAGAQAFDIYEKKSQCFDGPVIMCCGGLNGMFPGMTTGTTANTGSAAAELFLQGVEFADLEFIQYHPTTVPITGKRLLVTEAARGEGSRLFYIKEDGSRCYWLEEKFGERGNLMPRDVISREEDILGRQVFIDMTPLSDEIWAVKLPDLREEIMHYLLIDPKKDPVPVSPGIHYFMGGIRVDEGHRTNITGLYAAGECACAYHGANRLGGNSLLGAIYGGKKAAETAAEEADSCFENDPGDVSALFRSFKSIYQNEAPAGSQMEQFLLKGLSVRRDENGIKAALDGLHSILPGNMSDEFEARYYLSEAMLLSALERRESRGAHTRLDWPETSDEFRKITVVRRKGNNTEITFADIRKTGEAYE